MSRPEAVAAVHEGWRLHYGPAQPDPDLALLLGDRRYAEGLERLAATGDLEAITALADLITGCARAAAEGRPDDAEAAWARARADLALDH